MLGLGSVIYDNSVNYGLLIISQGWLSLSEIFVRRLLTDSRKYFDNSVVRGHYSEVGIALTY